MLAVCFIFPDSQQKLPFWKTKLSPHADKFYKALSTHWTPTIQKNFASEKKKKTEQSKLYSKDFSERSYNSENFDFDHVSLLANFLKLGEKVQIIANNHENLIENLVRDFISNLFKSTRLRGLEIIDEL